MSTSRRTYVTTSGHFNTQAFLNTSSWNATRRTSCARPTPVREASTKPPSGSTTPPELRRPRANRPPKRHQPGIGFMVNTPHSAPRILQQHLFAHQSSCCRILENRSQDRDIERQFTAAHRVFNCCYAGNHNRHDRVWFAHIKGPAHAQGSSVCWLKLLVLTYKYLIQRMVSVFTYIKIAECPRIVFPPAKVDDTK